MKALAMDEVIGPISIKNHILREISMTPTYRRVELHEYEVQSTSHDGVVTFGAKTTQTRNLVHIYMFGGVGLNLRASNVKPKRPIRPEARIL